MLCCRVDYRAIFFSHTANFGAGRLGRGVKKSAVWLKRTIGMWQAEVSSLSASAVTAVGQILLSYGKEKLEDMDISLEMSAARSGPTLQT